jgi:hypothetical protein
MSQLNNQKILQAINLSPPVDEDFFDKLEKVHPMKQIVYASIIQLCVFGFMLASFWLISKGI